jgi:D-alanyl-D-alanine carboxypeptidase/D-alanyl-D-alanine-endopeptidase (penicillin-binding protein 4)
MVAVPWFTPHHLFATATKTVAKSNTQSLPRKKMPPRTPTRLKKRVLTKTLTGSKKSVTATPHTSTPLTARETHHKEHQEQLRALRTTIDNLVKEADKQASVGVKVVLLKQNSTIYEKNASHLFTPASNTKLITAAAAYHMLGPEYRFKTKFYTDKKVGTHAIHNLYVVGAGDPTLTDKDLVAVAQRLRKLGIHDIKGSIVVDSSLFAREKASAPGWSRGDGPIFDKAPTGAFMVNHSCITIQIRPSRIAGKKPLVIIDPPAHVPIKNTATTKAVGAGHTLHVVQGAANSLIIRGTIGKKSRTRYYRMAVTEPNLYAGNVLAAVLKAQKILVRGTVVSGIVPEKARLLEEHSSAPLDEIMVHLMKKSDNLYADALFRLFGAQSSQQAGSWANGKKAVEQFLHKTVGLDISDLKIFDGSGLSHSNKVSPNQFIELLTWIYTQSPYKENFIASLPIGGVDGSLRNRMKQTEPHTVKAKTGNLTGVTCLSGYITPKTGLPLIFVIMVNRKNKSAVMFKRKLEDQLCNILATHAFSTS